MTSNSLPNFAFLAYHDPVLVTLTTQAEAVFPHDAVGCLVRLRAFDNNRGRKGRPPKNP